MTPASPESQLDRLVDGELSETDRRKLLVQLEHEPDGWRRCALAFLEAQCWRQELGIMTPAAERAESAAPAVAVIASVASPAATGRRWAWRQQLATALTVAASVLIALSLGIGFHGGLGGGHGPDNSVVNQATLPVGNQVTATAPQPTTQAVQPNGGRWELVTLPAAAPGGPVETVGVPVVERDAFDQNLIEQLPPAMPPEVQQAFEQSGRWVRQQREIVPAQTKDGRPLMVPVDKVEIHYVGRGSL